MQIHTMPVGLIGTNCYIVVKGREALVFDPGGDVEEIIAFIEKEDLHVHAILLTHAHYDHIGALEELRESLAVDVYIHESEQSWLGDPKMNGSHKLLGHEIIAKRAEHSIQEGRLTISDFDMEVMHTPGHSPGSVSFLFEKTEDMISGDVLFNQGIGRTDLPGGDVLKIEHTIKEKLYKLDEAYTVYPGHGPKTTIGFEKENNPFFRAE